MNDLEEKIERIVKMFALKRNCVNDITKVNLVDDLGYDSFSLVQLAVAIEDEFNITFETQDFDFQNIVHIDYLFELVKKLVIEKENNK